MGKFQVGILVGMALGAYIAWIVGEIVSIRREIKARLRQDGR